MFPMDTALNAALQSWCHQYFVQVVAAWWNVRGHQLRQPKLTAALLPEW